MSTAIGNLSDNSAPGHIAKLSMTYEAASSEFTAYFRFDERSRLVDVELEGADGVTNIIPILTSKYGAPKSDHDTDGIMRIAKWQTKTDEIIAMELAGVGDTQAHTSITYRARNSADTKGL